jgi:predicted DNA-binding transcriptional regulator YafY
MDGYRTKLTGFTQSEAETLFLVGLSGPAAQLGLSDLLLAARTKLLAALPANLQMDAERVASRIHLDPAGWFRDSDPPSSLQAVASAVWSGHYLHLQYRNAGEIYPRKLGPLGLVLKAGVWYLVAQSGKSVRTYRVENVLEVKVGEEPFQRPKAFDLPRYWETASRAYEADTYRRHAEVRISPKGFSRLGLLGPYVTKAAGASAGKPDRHGWIRCVIPAESGEGGLLELMRLGDEVEIVGPAALREQMAATLASMLRRHSKTAHRN